MGRSGVERVAALALAVALPACAGAHVRQGSSAPLGREAARRLGERLDAALGARLPLVDDPAVQAEVARVAARVAAAIGGRRLGRPTIAIVDAPASAYLLASPSGKIHVHSGLLLSLRSEAELAAALAHELAHLEREDLLRALRSEYGAGLLEAAADGSAPALIEAAADELGSPTGRLAGGALAEQAADDATLRALAVCGYDPRAAIGLAQRLGALRSASPERTARLDAAHPGAPDRVGALLRAAARLPRGGWAASRPGFTRLRAHLERRYAARPLPRG